MRSSRRVLGVIRLSKDTNESTSAERQRHIITQWATARGDTIVGWAEDLGVSGSIDPWQRPQLGAWLRGDHTPFDVIVIWRLDRLARRVLHFASLLDWARTSGTDLASATEGFDLSTPLGRMFAQMITMLAEGELEAIKERTKNSYDHLVSIGRHRGGFLPYGYRTEPAPDGGYRLIIDPDAARVVHTIVERILAGHSINSVVTWLNANNIPTSLDLQRLRAGKPARGTTWRVGNLSKMLRSTTLLGYLHPDNGQPIIGDDGRPVRRADPILTDQQWRQLQTTLTQRRTHRATPHRRNAAMLLRVAFCGTCGRPLYLTKGRTRLYYRCASKAIGGTACGNPSVPTDHLEHTLTDVFLARVGHLQVTRRVLIPGQDHTTEINERQTAIERLVDRLEKLPTGGSAETAILTRLRSHEQRLAELQHQPSRPDQWHEEPVGVTFRQMWNQLDDAGRGKLLRDCHVTIRWTPLCSRIDLGDLEELATCARRAASDLDSAQSDHHRDRLLIDGPGQFILAGQHQHSDSPSGGG